MDPEVRALVTLFWEVYNPGATRFEAWASVSRCGYLKPVACVISSRMAVFVAGLEIPWEQTLSAWVIPLSQIVSCPIYFSGQTYSTTNTG